MQLAMGRTKTHMYGPEGPRMQLARGMAKHTCMDLQDIESNWPEEWQNTHVWTCRTLNAPSYGNGKTHMYGPEGPLMQLARDMGKTDMYGPAGP